MKSKTLRERAEAYRASNQYAPKFAFEALDDAWLAGYRAAKRDKRRVTGLKDVAKTQQTT